MSNGNSSWSPWIEDEEESIKLIKEAYAADINFFDTAGTYSNGESEIVLGKALKEIGANRGCVDASIAGIPWPPLAMGALTGKNRKTTRTESKFQLQNFLPDKQKEIDDTIIDRIEEVAKKHNKTCAQIALAWLYTKKYVTSPIVGVSKIEQLHDLMGPFEINLIDEEVKYLEEPYVPRRALAL
ncbi:hypothetical protein HPULCUR_000614 [Helicostylum pulchrum]|uniref:NADP-dependent oxidoreductase domain-containing protein n=1 Tax=Helicostylum pulchrum TaxID=562976 RepID=A0ABP9XKG5_9FUNG